MVSTYNISPIDVLQWQCSRILLFSKSKEAPLWPKNRLYEIISIKFIKIYIQFIKNINLSSTHNFISAYQIFEYLRIFHFPSNCLMASLYVLSLFTSITIDYTFEITQKIWPNCNMKSVLNILDIVELVQFCLNSNCFVFENKIS